MTELLWVLAGVVTFVVVRGIVRGFRRPHVDWKCWWTCPECHVHGFYVDKRFMFEDIGHHAVLHGLTATPTYRNADHPDFREEWRP